MVALECYDQQLSDRGRGRSQTYHHLQPEGYPPSSRALKKTASVLDPEGDKDTQVNRALLQGDETSTDPASESATNQ